MITLPLSVSLSLSLSLSLCLSLSLSLSLSLFLKKQAQWLSISKGMFELTEWHSIAKEWFGEKPRNSEEVSNHVTYILM